MFESNYKFKTMEDEYDLVLPIDDDFKHSKKRVLIVIGTVPTLSLKEGHLLPTKTIVRNTLVNAIDHTKSILSTYGKSSAGFKYAAINFNAYKSFNLKSQARTDAESKFKDRIRKAIRKLKPTHLLICGRTPATMIDVADVHAKTGWVHQYGKGILAVNTFDYEVLCRDVGDGPNMLGMFCRHLANLLAGEMLHKVETTVSNPIYVDTSAKFNRMMGQLEKAKFVAVDTETRNLSVLHNAIYTIQFATDLDPTIGYVVPLNHPLTEVSPKLIRFMHRRLKDFFSQKKGPTLVTFNGMFDLRVIRGEFKLPILWYSVWEITAGEHLLDENVSLIRRLSHKNDSQGGLRNCLTSYGDDFYYQPSSFTKEDRGTTGTVKPDSEGFLTYAAKDVTCLLQIKKCQEDRASYMKIGKHNYRPVYINHVLNMMGDSAHQLSHLRADGSVVNRKYLRDMLKPDSKFRAEIRKIQAQYRTLESAKAANEALLKEAGIRTNSLFGSGNSSNWIFSLSKPAHRSTLFYDVMGLEVVSQTPKGEPSTNKHFVKHYKGKYPEVDLYEEWGKTSKLLNTYIKGWYKILTTNADAATDSTLRPDYLFYDVVTGRLASRNPSLQVIPSRGPLSTIIKEAFEVPTGHLLIRFDYSAHEVRGWSILSGDMKLADAFRNGQTLRKKLIMARSEGVLNEIRQELRTKGDIHIQNVHRFFNKWVEKSDPIREAVKAVVFGTLYGMSASTLGVSVSSSRPERIVITQKISNLGKKLEAGGLSRKEVARLEKEIRILRKKDLAMAKDEDSNTAYAQEIIDKMFAEFEDGATWTKWAKESAESKYYVYSSAGRRRNLWAVLTGDKKVISRQVRRGSNAPIQGFCSEIGTKASRLIMESYYEEYPKFQKPLNLPEDPWEGSVKINRLVHDASYFTVPYEMVLPFVHFAQYQATYGIARTVEKQFNMKFTIEPEIEMEFAAKDSQDNTQWDWTAKNLMEVLHRAVVQAHAQGSTGGKSVKQVMDIVLKPYHNRKMLDYLQRKYPILGVNEPEVIANIEDAVSCYTNGDLGLV